MILTETLKCTVPSPNAVKDATITCVTGATNMAEIWTAAGTIVLAIFAIAAWLASRKNHKYMQDQIDLQAQANRDAKTAASEQLRKQQAAINVQVAANTKQLEKQQDMIDATTMAGIVERQIAASSTYYATFEAATRLLSDVTFKPEKMKRAMEDIQSTGNLWRMHFWQDGDLCRLTLECEHKLHMLAWESGRLDPSALKADSNPLGFQKGIVALQILAMNWYRYDSETRKDTKVNLQNILKDLETRLQKVSDMVASQR